MMSKKHYIQFAEMFKAERESLEIRKEFMSPDGYKFAESEIRELTLNTADIFQSDNPNFDRNRFLNACGLTSK